MKMTKTDLKLAGMCAALGAASYLVSRWVTNLIIEATSK